MRHTVLPPSALAFALCLALAGAWPVLGAERTVRVAIYDFAPLCDVKAAMHQAAGASKRANAGLAVALTEHIANAEKWKVEYVPGTAAEGLERLREGTVDLAVAAAGDPEREAGLQLSREAIISTWAQVYAGERSGIQSPLDLASRAVGVPRDDPYGAEVRDTMRRFDVKCQFVEFNSYQDVFDAVENRWVDAGVVDRLFGFQAERGRKLVRTPIILAPVELRFAVAQGRGDALLAALDYHLDRLKRTPDSFYYQEFAKVLGPPPTPLLPPWLAWALGAAALLLAALGGFSILLRRQVARQTSALSRTNEDLLREVLMRKQAEQERMQLVLAVEQSADGIAITDAEGRLCYGNAAFERLVEMPRNEFLGQGLNSFFAPSPSLAEEPAAAGPDGEVRTGRFTRTRSDGAAREVDATLSPIRDGEGEAVRTVCHLRDVTREIRMERQMRQMQKMEAMGTLAGGIAHDFNNILFPIVAYTEMVRAGLDAASREARRLEGVLEAASRAKELVKQILAFSRPKEERRTCLRVEPILKETMKLLRPSLPTTIDIRLSLQPGCSPVLADPTQMHQVLMNLCTNAYHAMRERGGVLELELQETVVAAGRPPAPGLVPGRYVRLTVRDTGHGMEPAVLDRIFDPYFTTKAPGEGTGMGLAVVHSIVTACNGAITVSSQVGTGTEFHIYLPCAEETAEKRPTEAPAGQSLAGTERILFVDDELAIVRLMSDMLACLGYRVTACSSSTEAWRRFSGNPEDFDLLITDQTMPDLTGTQLAQQVLALRPSFPIILCTGYSAIVTAEEARSLGICRFLPKPILRSDMARCIREALALGQPVPAAG